MGNDIKQRVQNFKDDLAKNSCQQVLRQHVIFGECYSLDHNCYFELKQEIATKFEIHPSEVIMVGSGKLGFSPTEKKKYNSETGEHQTKPRFREFGEESDLDIAILSPSLFDNFWLKLYEFKKTRTVWSNENSFKKYLFNGWIRPDLLPPNSSGLSIRDDWFDFFDELTRSGKYGDFAINAGLYKNWNYLEGYQYQAIEECKLSLGI